MDIQGNKARPFVTVGDVELPVDTVDKALEAQMSQSQLPPGIMDSLPPEYKLQMIAQAVSSSIQSAEMFEVAKRLGFSNDDDSVKKAFHLSSESDFRNFAITSLRKAGQLKENSTDKDFDDLVKKEAQGKTISEIYKSQLTEFESTLKDNQKKMQLVLAGAQRYAMEKLQAGINPTDDEVKKSFETYEIKRVVVRVTDKVTADQAKAKIDKAYADLKAGKSFEDVMDAYTDDIAQDKKKKSESVMSLNQDMIDQNPDFKVIQKLQPGSYSEPEKVAEGYVVYKYAGKKMTLPKDYEANKALYKGQFISVQTSKKFKEEIDKVEKEIKPNFEIKAYEAVFQFQKAMTAPAGAEQGAALQTAYDTAKAVDKSADKADIAAMVEVAAMDKLYNQPTADKAKLKEPRIASLEKYLSFFDNWSYRKEVIDNYKELKSGDKAFDQILIAMDKNTKYDQMAQNTFSDVSSKFLELKQAGLIKPEQETQFRDKQEKWQKEKKLYEKEEAAMKAQAEADKKKAEEEAKKNKAAAPQTPAPKK
jgi:hypothetical protein